MSENNEVKEKQTQNQNKNGGQGQHRSHHRHHRGKGNNRQGAQQNNEQNKNQETAQQKQPQGGQQQQKKNQNGQQRPQSQKNQKQNQKGNRKEQPRKTEPVPSIFDMTPENDSVFGNQTSAFTPAAPKKSAVKYSEPVETRQLTDEELFGISHMVCVREETDEPTVEVVGVRFKPNGKVYYFAPNGFKLSRGDKAIVDTARGMEFGEVCMPNRMVKESDTVQPLHPVCRPAAKDDIDRHEYNKLPEKDAFKICLDKIAQHGLDMKLVDVQCSFDNSKLLFYFTSAGRVDFRELVRDLAAQFKTRIELRQIGIRDEAKLVGGIGICGRPLCCSRHLSNFAQVSIKMAKEQGLSLSSNKISGNCGRLMCCLNYENQTYVEEIKRTPMPGSQVKVNGTPGTVTDANPLTGMLKVKLTDSEGQTVSVHRDEIVLISKKEFEEPEGEE